MKSRRSELFVKTALAGMPSFFLNSFQQRKRQEWNEGEEDEAGGISHEGNEPSNAVTRPRLAQVGGTHECTELRGFQLGIADIHEESI